MSFKVIATNNAPTAIGPYSQGVNVGNLVFTSGQVPINAATGEVVTGGFEIQATQVLENLKAVLEASGVGIGDIIKTTVFLKDMNDFATLNSIYAEYFKAPFPARSCVEAARLPKDVSVEIEAIAVKG